MEPEPEPTEENDPCRTTYDYVDFSASSPYEAQEGSNVYFTISSDSGPGYEGRYCSASVDYFLHASTVGEPVETGEDHTFSLSVEVTEAEYTDCKNTLNTLKDQLPETCYIDTSGGWW